MSIQPELTIPPQPSVERGVSVKMDLDPTGNILAYCSGTNVILRNLTDVQDVYVYVEHGSTPTTAVRISPNGNWIASGDSKGVLIVWSAKGEHTQKGRFQLCGGRIRDIAWDEESKRIAVCGDQPKDLKCVMFDTGNSIGEPSGHTKRVLSLDLRKKRPYKLVSSGEDFTIAVNAGPPFKFEKTLSGHHTGFVECVRYSPDSEFFASCGGDKTPCLFDGKTGDLIKKFSVPSGCSSTQWSLDWLDNQYFVIACANKTLQIYNKDGGEQPEHVLKLGKQSIEDMPQGIVCNSRKGILATVTLNGNVVVYTKEAIFGATSTGDPMMTIEGSRGALSSCVEAAGAIFYAGNDGLLCKEKKGIVTRKNLDGKSIKCITAVPGIGVQAATRNKTVVLLDEDLNNSPRTIDIGGVIVGMTVLGKKSLLVATTTELLCLDPSTGTQIWKRPGKHSNGGEITSIAASSIGNYAVAFSGLGGDVDKAWRPVVLYDGSSGSEIAHSEQHVAANVDAMSFSPDGSLLAVGDDKKRLFIYETKQTGVITPVPGTERWTGHHAAKIQCLNWSATSGRLVSGSLDRSCIVWDVTKPTDGNCRIKIENCHKDGVTGVIFLPDGKLISVGADGSVKRYVVTEDASAAGGT